MDELDFTIPPGKLALTPSARSNYDAAEVLEFFRTAGKAEDVSAGKVIFSENEKARGLLLQRNKMYLLLEGEVDVSVQGRLVNTVRKDEIFGEMASITNMPRTATATARTACSLIALDDKQLRTALHDRPEFILTLMGVITERLRKMLAGIADGDIQPAGEEKSKAQVFDKKMLAYLADEVGHGALMRYAQNKVIAHEGQPGVLMYVVLEGRVAISIQNNVVERIGPGGMFGEMALVESTTRLASAIAETDCSLLAINRNLFLDLVKNNPEFGIALLAAVGERARGTAVRQAL